MQKPAEILAPAGDEPSIFAALRAGADAVYFGLAGGFNARARAENVPIARLAAVMQGIHDLGRRGYLTLNTLVFDHELEQFELLLREIAKAGVDAVIVQDLGVASWVRSLCPSLRLHASTQMTCTDSSSIALAQSLGASRVTLARELSLTEVTSLAQSSAIELEVFAHGALCVAYSGQCLTSEAIGGRSANRGACAQACRLPYDLFVDGILSDMGDQAYLLSPRDLDTSQRIPELLAAGVSAIKIEGRLKSAEYVAATTHLYRRAVDAAMGKGPGPSAQEREASAQSFSRGASVGFVDGTNHQRLVDGTTCDHIGVEAGTCTGLGRLASKTWLRLSSICDLSRGDGILIQGGKAGKGEVGGRIWSLSVAGRDAEHAEPNRDVWVWLGPDKDLPQDVVAKRIFRTSSPKVTKFIEVELSKQDAKLGLIATLSGKVGEQPVLQFESQDGRSARVALDCVVELAKSRPLDEAVAFDKLARLGDTPYALSTLNFELVEGGTLSLSALNRARRDAVTLLSKAAARSHETVEGCELSSRLAWPTFEPASPGLFVTCRNLEQAEASIRAGATGVYLDFLALTGAGPALRALRNRLGRDVSLGVALPRIRKPGEEKIDRYIWELEADAILLRSLGSLYDVERHQNVDVVRSGDGAAATTHSGAPLLVADFALNVANSLSAIEVLSRGARVFTPSYDLDAAQLQAMLSSPLAPYAEVVIYHPMPLFHMEHCVIAAALSTGKDHRDCGRPCDRHQVSLRDRTGLMLPVEADIGCRNTVFHGKSQSADERLPALKAQGVRRFRIELVRQTAQDTESLIGAYRELIDGEISPVQLRERLRQAGMSVVSGSLRVVG